jgi:hypothetical protein
LTGKLTDVVGTIFVNKWDESAEVIEYKSSRDVTIKFTDSGHISKSQINHLRNGQFLSPYSKTVYGRGYRGNTDYLQYGDESISARWALMIGRCYDDGMRLKNPTYADCTVCDEWFSYENYSGWYMAEPYRQPDWDVDKDIMYPGNRIYSPSTCTFVPPDINSFINLNSSRRGTWPVGVYYIKRNKNFAARCRVGGRDAEWLGVFHNHEDAFYAYKKAKESYGKVLAERFKDQVHPLVYERLRTFTVDIDD